MKKNKKNVFMTKVLSVKTRHLPPHLFSHNDFNFRELIPIYTMYIDKSQGNFVKFGAC